MSALFYKNSREYLRLNFPYDLTDRRFRQILQALLDGEISSMLRASRSYLITLSALASTLGGIVRPICFAVLRLITNSNFVGCSTGRSAGFAPLRILST